MAQNCVVPLRGILARKRSEKNKSRKLQHKGLKLLANGMQDLKDVGLMVSRETISICKVLLLTQI